MSIAFINDNKQENPDIYGAHASNFSFDFKALFLPIMQKNRRSSVFGAFLILFHFLLLFSLQFHSSDFPIQSGLMPAIHFVLSKFNVLFLVSDPQTRIDLMYGFIGFNIGYLMSMIILGFLSNLTRKNWIRKSLTRFHIYCFQVYNWAILIPSMLISSNIWLDNSCSGYCNILNILNIFFTIFIANFIEYSRININFKCEDSLDSRNDITDRILINFKIFVIISSGIHFYADYWLILLFLLFLAEYIRKINYYVEKISTIYLSCINCFLFVDIIYFCIYNSIINLQKVDISYLLLFGCSFLLKMSLHLRGFLVIHKMKRIAKNGLKSNIDFDLYIRETFSNLHNFEIDLEAKLLFLSFFSMHQNKCKLKDCVCKTLKISTKTSYLRNKKTFKKVIESYFIEYLSTIKEQDFEETFLMYCSFITNILKIPGKALKFLIINRIKIKSLKNRILIDILIKKSKKSLEKKLLNNDQYAQSFSTVIYFDHEIRVLESSLRHVIVNQLQIGSVLLNTIESPNKSFDAFVELGNEVIQSIDKSKEQAKRLFDLNVNNVRLTQLTTLIIKYLSEDMSFRNFYKQLNIKKINQDIQKRKKKDKTLDIFDNDAGVVFITLSKEIGLIKKFSKNVPKIFGSATFEMKNHNIKEFMPLIFGQKHDFILENFVNTGKAAHLISGLTPLYGINKENLLLHLNLIIRLDTFFTKDFMIGAYIKTMRNSMNKTILIDIHGNFISCSKEITNYLNFSKLTTEDQHKISMILLIPDIMEKIMPFDLEDVALKQNTDFKMKGFLLIPNEVDENNINNISIKQEIYGSFKDFQSSENSLQKYQNLRSEVTQKLFTMMPQDFKFYRIHFTLIIQNYQNNMVNVRLIEIFDILEIQDMKLQIQYLSKKNKKFKDLLKNEAEKPLEKSDLIDEENLENHKNAHEIKSNIIKSSEDAIIQLVVSTKKHLNPNLLSIDKEDEKLGESYLSVTNRTEIDHKLKQLTDNSNQVHPLSDSLINLKSEAIILKSESNMTPVNNQEPISEFSDELKPLKSEDHTTSEQNLLNKPNDNLHAKTSLSTIEQESDLSYGRDEQNFEEKISEMSNDLKRKESEEEETLNDDDKSHTRGGSQVSRVSSHASGDSKKSTLDILNLGGLKKIEKLKFINILLFSVFFIVTIIFFVLIRTETFNLEITLQNSGIFHNQVSPLCVLVRDSIIYKFLYSGLIQLNVDQKKELMDDTSSSLDFNNILLTRAYKTGIAQADANVNFIYLKFLDVTIQNVTLYSILVNNINDSYIKHIVPIKLLPDNIIYMSFSIPQSILFFLSAAEHFYYSEILNDIKNASDSYNYIFFLQENILGFVRTMLDLLEINNQKINGSVSYISDLNLAFFLITLFGIIYGITHTLIISIQAKLKANKFCSLFFHFQEKEIDDRCNKLRVVLDKYFDQKNSMFVTDITSLSRSLASSGKKKLDLISTDKLNLLRSENFSTQKMSKRKHRTVKRNVVINQFRGRNFQIFLLIFLFFSFSIGASILGLYVSNYMSGVDFFSNVIEITGDLESVESYVLTLHIQYAANFNLMGLYDETPQRKVNKMEESDNLLVIVDAMQSKITDLANLFKVSNTQHILTQLKYEFFTNDICELIGLIKKNIDNQIDDVKEIANKLQGTEFCQKLLKNVMTKGSTSFAFEVTEIFKQWKDYIRKKNYSLPAIVKIIQSQEFLDINYALPYVYALGLYDISLMMSNSEAYFQNTRNNSTVLFILTLIVITFLLIVPYQKLIRHLNVHSNACFSLIKIFPYAMISNNKMLENKIARLTRHQKI